MGRKLKDEEIIGPDGLDCVVAAIQALVPFV